MKSRLATNVLFLWVAFFPIKGAAIACQIDDLMQKLNSDEISSISVLAISENIFSNVRVKPDVIESNYFYKVELNERGLNQYRKSLVDTISNISVIYSP